MNESAGARAPLIPDPPGFAEWWEREQAYWAKFELGEMEMATRRAWAKAGWREALSNAQAPQGVDHA